MKAHSTRLRAVRALRRRLEEHIEAMVDFLDRLDGDPDIEDGGDHEPFLTATHFDHAWAATNMVALNENRPNGIDTSDRELEDEHDEEGHDREDDRADVEPSLGWTFHEAHHRDGGFAPTSHWGWDDLELDTSDDEPEEDIGIEDMTHDEENVL